MFICTCMYFGVIVLLSFHMKRQIEFYLHFYSSRAISLVMILCHDYHVTLQII